MIVPKLDEPSPDELKKFPGEKGKGNRVIKFSPDGKILMTIGKGGAPGDPPESLNEPCDIILAPNGDILISEGHSGQSENPPPGTVGHNLMEALVLRISLSGRTCGRCLWYRKCNGMRHLSGRKLGSL